MNLVGGDAKLARLSLQTLPFWQFDVGLFDDMKMADLNNKFGTLGEAIFFRVLSLIANTEGYFSQINDQLILSIYRSVGSKWIKSKTVISDVIHYCGVCGLFDVNLLTQNVITSRGIQRRWLYAKQKSRAKGYSTAKFWLLDKSEQDMSFYCNKDNSCNNNSDKCNINADKCNINSLYQGKVIKGNIDSQTAEADENENEINFYLENIEDKISALDDEKYLEYKQRLRDILAQAKKVGSFNINKIKVSLAEFLQTYQFIFTDPEQVKKVLDTIDNNSAIKNKFAYTISSIYNTVKKF